MWLLYIMIEVIIFIKQIIKTYVKTTILYLWYFPETIIFFLFTCIYNSIFCYVCMVSECTQAVYKEGLLFFHLSLSPDSLFLIIMNICSLTKRFIKQIFFEKSNYPRIVSTGLPSFDWFDFWLTFKCLVRKKRGKRRYWQANPI